MLELKKLKVVKAAEHDIAEPEPPADEDTVEEEIVEVTPKNDIVWKSLIIS